MSHTLKQLPLSLEWGGMARCLPVTVYRHDPMYITLYIITETIETTVCCVGLQYPCCTVCMCFANRVAWQCCMYDTELFVSFNDHVIQTAGSCQGKCPDKCVCLIGCECLPGQCVWKERLVQSEVMMLSLVLHFNIWQCVLCAWIAKGEVVGFCLNCQKQEVEGWLKTVWLQCDNYGRRIWIWWTNKVSCQPAGSLLAPVDEDVKDEFPVQNSCLVKLVRFEWSLRCISD